MKKTLALVLVAALVSLAVFVPVPAFAGGRNYGGYHGGYHRGGGGIGVGPAVGIGVGSFLLGAIIGHALAEQPSVVVAPGYPSPVVVAQPYPVYAQPALVVQPPQIYYAPQVAWPANCVQQYGTVYGDPAYPAGHSVPTGLIECMYPGGQRTLFYADGTLVPPPPSIPPPATVPR